MWQRYSSNILVTNEYAEECWLGVHSNASLQWLFGPVFLTTQLSINAQTPLMKRVKEMFCLRRLLAEMLIATQQQNIRSINSNATRVQSTPLRRSRLVGSNLSRNLVHLGARIHQSLVANPGQGPRVYPIIAIYCLKIIFLVTLVLCANTSVYIQKRCSNFYNILY
jgi:hypothetical protein